MQGIHATNEMHLLSVQLTAVVAGASQTQNNAGSKHAKCVLVGCCRAELKGLQSTAMPVDAKVKATPEL